MYDGDDEPKKFLLKWLRIADQIEELRLWNNEIATIEKLSHLKKLKLLNLGDNLITQIPVGALDGLVQLEKLWLTDNKIKRIQGLEKLTSLRVLYLYGNQIEKIEGLEAQSQSLVRLDISNNKISNESNLAYLGHTLKKLEELYIYENPLCPGLYTATTSEFAKKVQDKIPTLKTLNLNNIGHWIK